MTLAQFLISVVVSTATTIVVSTIRFRVIDRRYFRRQLLVLDSIARVYPATLRTALRNPSGPINAETHAALVAAGYHKAPF